MRQQHWGKRRGKTLAAFYLHVELQEPGVRVMAWSNFYLNTGSAMTSAHLHTETRYSSRCNVIGKIC